MLAGRFLFGLILVPAFALAATKSAPKFIEPKISKDDGFHLDIGKQVQDAVKKYNPYFEAWNETDFIPSVRAAYKPSASQTMSGIVADFNNDKVKDVALFGRTRRNNVLLAAVSQEDGSYKVIEIDRAPLLDPRRGWIEGVKGKELGLWTYLNYQKPGWFSSRFEQKPIQLKAEAFSEQYFQKGSVLYYYKEGKFDRFTKEGE